jgi:hypothetical protein
MIDGTKYLLNDTTKHLMIVLTVAASATAQSIRPVDLSKNSFAVMPSIIKKRKKRESSSSVILAEHEHSNSCCSASNESCFVYVHAKKKNKKTGGRTNNKKKTTQPVDLVLSHNSSSGDEDKMTVVDDPVIIPTVSSEVKTQDLPESADFNSKANKVQEEDDILEGDPIMSHLSQNILEDNNDDKKGRPTWLHDGNKGNWQLVCLN